VTFWNDVRLAARLLLKDKCFTLAAVAGPAPERFRGAFISANTFALIGARPVLHHAGKPDGLCDRRAAFDDHRHRRVPRSLIPCHARRSGSCAAR
jgi:hypothetical protein